MKKTIGSYEAKTHLPKILDKVSKGKRFTITKHGTAVAELVPIGNAETRDSTETIKKIRELRKGLSLKGLSIKKMIGEGRRY